MKRDHGPPLFAAVASLVASITMAVLYGIPRPRTHDEFSYVLAGDTFASGRLANPTHPLWRSFETFHVLSRPSYASKYHAAQGLFLALGDLLGQRPWLGVWLSVALASAAVAWMLLPVLEGPWRYVAALQATLTIGCTYWAYSYWGGAVAALGGALLVGAALRVRAASSDAIPSRALAVVGALGTVLLLLSRPLEGGLTWACLAIASVMHLRSLAPARRRALLVAIVPPYAAIVGAGVAFLLYEQHRVTGNAFLPPYVLYERTYFETPPFVWGSLRSAPPPLTEEFVEFARYNLRRYEAATGPTWLADLGYRGSLLLGHYLSPIALALPFALRADTHLRVVRLALASIAIVLAVMIGSLWSYPHYLAPLTGYFVFVFVRGLAGLARVEIDGRRIGRVIASTLVILAVVGTLREMRDRGTWSEVSWSRRRAALEDRLAATGEAHLVVVRYVAPHDFLQEWVYDRARIDDAPVVFAREIDDAETHALLDHFPARKAWLLTVTDGHEDLAPLRGP